MKYITVDRLDNKKENDVIFDGNIKLAPFSKILNSSLLGNLFLGLSSCINRSEIGKYVGVAYFSYLADTRSGNYCTLGSRVSIGAFSHPTDSLTVHEVGYRNTTESYGETTLVTDSQSYLEARSIKTRIGHDVWVGDNSVVIKGVEIGNGAIVAAGSVVTKDVAPYSIVGGNPARTIRMRFSDDVINKIQASAWWDFSMKDLRGVPFENIDLSLEILKELRSRRGEKYR